MCSVLFLSVISPTDYNFVSKVIWAVTKEYTIYGQGDAHKIWVQIIHVMWIISDLATVKSTLECTLAMVWWSWCIHLRIITDIYHKANSVCYFIYVTSWLNFFLLSSKLIYQATHHHLICRIYSNGPSKSYIGGPLGTGSKFQWRYWTPLNKTVEEI